VQRRKCSNGHDHYSVRLVYYVSTKQADISTDQASPMVEDEYTIYINHFLLRDYKKMN